MRKDVKLGLAIGGVLLSVLIVYVLVISGADKPQQVVMVTSEAPAPIPPLAIEAPKPPVVEAPKPPVVAVPEKQDEKKDIVAAADLPPAAEPKAPATAPSAADRWAEGVLSTGKLPVMLTTTPQTPANPVDIQPPSIVAEANRSTPGGGENSTAASSNAPAAVAPAAPISATGGSPTPRPSMSRTHVVQPNETFASIAQAAYGNAAYFPHIIRANPTVDPRKLRPGMTIHLPPVSDVRADNTAVASSGSSVDAKTQYQVQPNDNLYKISVKLYGKPDQMDKIYELNKSTIGPDKQKVKPGMVLNLPQAPSQKLQ